VAAAIAPVAAQTEVASARCCTGNSRSTKPSEVGSRIAAPTAWTPRAATSTESEPASPLVTEAARNSRMPARNNRLRPRRSASRPAGTSAAANRML
jgi:hypothetical protein